MVPTYLPRDLSNLKMRVGIDLGSTNIVTARMMFRVIIAILTGAWRLGFANTARVWFPSVPVNVDGTISRNCLLPDLDANLFWQVGVCCFKKRMSMTSDSLPAWPWGRNICAFDSWR